jgi:GntR family transcriptional regulator
MNSLFASSLSLGQSRYGTLAASLRQRILDGEWQPGQMIPSEASLAQSYGVALGTLRQALSLLVQDGVLRRQHGKGTFVSRGLDNASMMRFFRFQSEGGPPVTPESRILNRRFRHPSVAEAKTFQIDSNGQVIQLERLRSIDGQPCLLETIVLPLPQFGALADSDTEDWEDLLYPMYQQRCAILVHHAQDELKFAQLNAAQASRLRLQAGHPCVLVERQAFDVAGRCVERRTTRGDAFSFTYTAHVK